MRSELSMTRGKLYDLDAVPEPKTAKRHDLIMLLHMVGAKPGERGYTDSDLREVANTMLDASTASNLGALWPIWRRS